MRVLVFGSRTWSDPESVFHVLTATCRLCMALRDTELVVTEGCCPTGADFWAERWARTMRVSTWPVTVTVDHHPPTGFGALDLRQRNVRMADTRPDMAFGFMRGETPGSAHMREELRLRSVPTHIIRWAEPLEGSHDRAVA